MPPRSTICDRAASSIPASAPAPTSRPACRRRMVLRAPSIPELAATCPMWIANGAWRPNRIAGGSTWRARSRKRANLNGKKWGRGAARSEEHTSELQSLMRNSYAVFFLKKKTKNITNSEITALRPNITTLTYKHHHIRRKQRKYKQTTDQTEQCSSSSNERYSRTTNQCINKNQLITTNQSHNTLI